jgi:hypothetical protein
MVVCSLCKEEFKDNSGGQLTNHLVDYHNMNREDYFIINELNGVDAKCACGYCNERPTFYRNRFLKFASGHNNPDWKKDQYLKKFGIPHCKTCGEEVKFFRGVPNTYCDSGCRPSTWNQEKIKNTIKEKYGVNNLMQVKEFRDIISKNNKELWENNYDDQLKKIKKTNLERFGVEFTFQSESVKEKQKLTMVKNHGVVHYSKTDKFRSDSSKRMFSNNPMKNPITSAKVKETQAKNNKWTSITEKYKSTDLCFQSSYEYDFLEFCENCDVLHLIKKSPTFKYFNKESYHFPDYIYNDSIVIEIKSKWILDIQGGDKVIQEKIKSVESTGKYKYMLILDKDYYQFEDLIKQIK